ncbi:MAG TPA: hypothetical protein DEA50_11285 [Parvularcula sp.]|nr:hypothetical protein [Parvularcula sp.]
MILSADEFVELRRNNDPRAAHEEANFEVWMDVISNYPDMKEWVVHNKTVPLEILLLLADDPDSDIRACVADKRKLSEQLFEKLSLDVDDLVRQRIASNKKTPFDILKRLSQDKSRLVREAAIKSLGERES